MQICNFFDLICGLDSTKSAINLTLLFGHCCDHAIIPENEKRGLAPENEESGAPCPFPSVSRIGTAPIPRCQSATRCPACSAMRYLRCSPVILSVQATRTRSNAEVHLSSAPRAKENDRDADRYPARLSLSSSAKSVT